MWLKTSTGDATTVTGLRPGFATVIATSGDVADTVQLRVRDPNTGPVATVTLAPAAASVAPGDSLTITATLRDAAGHELFDREIEWAVSDPSVVSIIGTYRNTVALSPNAPGTATVTATSEGKSGTATVTVN